MVGGGAERGHPAAAVEVATVEAGVDRAAGNDEPEPVGRGDLPAAPLLGEHQLGVVINDPGVRSGEPVRA